MAYIIETERLRLREFTLHDVDFIIELLNSAGWLQFIGDKNVKTVEQAKSYLENGPIKSYQTNGFGLSLVEKKDDAIAIGMCGIIKRENLDCPDIGFAFLPSFCGKGYAYEIANATLQYAKDKLKIPKIVAITKTNNNKSIRLLEKIGFNYIRPISLSDDKKDLSLYGQ